jgi:hypothetical protein
MANAEKKAKAEPAPKKETPSKETLSKDKSAPAADAPKAADTSKPAGGETTGDAPKNHSRGEGQKPVTQAYKDNWNAIFAKKKRR